MRVFPSSVFGGPHNEAVVLRETLAKRGYELLAVVPDEPGNAASWLERAGVTVQRMTLVRPRRVRSPLFWIGFWPRFIGDVRRLRRLLRSERVDVVEGSGIQHVQAALAARLEGLPVIWRLSDITTPSPLRRLLARWLPRIADAVLVDGDALLGYYPGIERLGDRVVVYYPSVDLERFSPARREGRGPATERLVIGTVANLNPDKGLEHLIEAAALVRQTVDADFVVVGAEHPTHGAYAAELRALVGARGLDSSFTFAGPQVDVVPWLRGMDLFVVSSLREGTTTTAIEALSVGLPVVATAVGAVDEVVEDEVVGKLVPARDNEALARAITELILDDGRRERMSRAARTRATTRFGLERTKGAYLRALEIAAEAVADGRLRQAAARRAASGPPR